MLCCVAVRRTQGCCVVLVCSALYCFVLIVSCCSVYKYCMSCRLKSCSVFFRSCNTMLILPCTVMWRVVLSVVPCFGGLKNFLNRDGPGHHSIDRPQLRRVEKGRGRRSILLRSETICAQPSTGNVSSATSGRLLRDRTERV